MLLILYRTESGANVINKTLEDAINIQITVRNDFDIINPQLKLSKIDGVNFQDYNYCYIPDLNRYYFINSVVAINADIFNFECECDVLETYKADILLSNARFKRKIKQGDYIDPDFEYRINADITTHESNKGFTGDDTMILTTVGSGF
jgi:hypothetical protein